MMPVEIFKRPMFALSISAQTCTLCAQGLAFVSLPFFFHTVLGTQRHRHRHPADRLAARAGQRRPIAGRLADRYHAGILGAIGLSSMTTGLVLTALLPPDPTTLDIMWRLVLCGAGFGIFASPNNRLMMNAVPRERSGSAGGIIATARTLGQTMGAALVALVFGLFDFSGRRRRRCRPGRDLARRRLRRRGPGHRQLQVRMQRSVGVTRVCAVVIGRGRRTAYDRPRGGATMWRRYFAAILAAQPLACSGHGHNSPAVDQTEHHHEAEPIRMGRGGGHVAPRPGATMAGARLLTFNWTASFQLAP